MNLALPGTLARRPSQLSTSTLALPSNAQAQASTSTSLSPHLGIGNLNGAAGVDPRPGPITPAKDEDDDEDDEGTRGKGKRKKSIAVPNGGAGGPETGGGSAGALLGKDYKYSLEIGQMMFVFGEVQDPLLETVKLVEDIVRGQIVEIITRARQLTQLRSSRFLSADDVIFLIRDDRGKVNRLRTYLSWKDVRKKAKDDESGEGGEVEIDDAARVRNTMVKLPWEVLTPFSDLLKGLPSRQNRAGDEDEEQDEDEMQAYQDSMQRLRDADEITKKMTKDEYVHYSDCRQASFTYRKAKRFREFVNFSAYLDVGPNDDIVDILGFLSFEMVRTLCVKSLEVRDRTEKSLPSGSAGGGKPQRRSTAKASASGVGGVGQKRKSLSVERVDEKITLSPEGVPMVISPEKADIALPAAGSSVGGGGGGGSGGGPSPMKRTKTGGAGEGGPAAPAPISLFAPPPSARQPLLPSHVLEAFAQIQRDQVGGRVGGMRNFRGGVMRGRLALV